MAADAPPAGAQSMTREELQAEAALQMHEIGRRFDKLPPDKDGLLKLLEDAETWLSRLDQNKARHMVDTLRPTKTVLVSRDLLDHPDPDVKLLVTTCLIEITRIGAPDSPYDEDVMKEILQRTVDTFSDLGDTNSPSYARRVSILDSAATVRCCLLMMDFKMTVLIRDMVNHIFKVASSNHSGKVTQKMETILRDVIGESDDIDEELATCLLANLTNEAQENLPASFGLADRLVGFYKDILKPVFSQSLRGKPLNIYSEVVRSLCQDPSSAVADRNTEASGTSMGTSELDKNANCPGDDQAKVQQLKYDNLEVSKKSQKIDSSSGSGMTEHAEVVKCNESPVASERLIPEINDGNDKQLKETGKKADDTVPVVTKKQDRPRALRSQGNKLVRTKQEDNRVLKRKCRPEDDETPSSKKNTMLDENLVGSRIRVWWPDDKRFYNGVVDSFTASSKKHKIAYDDGDVEILLLEKERWELIDEVQDSDVDQVSDMSCGRRGKGSSGHKMKEGKTTGCGDPSKKRGRPKSVGSIKNMSTAIMHPSSTKFKGKHAEKDHLKTPDRRITRSATRAKKVV